MKRKPAAMALALLLCTSLLLPSAGAAYEHDRVLITDEMEDEIYQFYVDHIEDFAQGKTITVKKSWEEDDGFKRYDKLRLRALEAYDNDHPEFFFATVKLTNAHGTIGSGGKWNYSMDYYPQFSINWRPVEDGGLGWNAWEDYQALMRRVEELAAQCRAAGYSRYAQLLYLHDWLTMNNAYNKPCYEADKTPEGYPDILPHTVLAALLPDSSPVCDSYSLAFKLVCNALDIPCIYTPGVGFVKTPGGSMEMHRWNYVQMEDGKWYLVDVTWDDPIPSGDWHQVVSGLERHTYFLRGEGEDVISQSYPTGLHELNDYYPVISKADYDPAVKPAAPVQRDYACADWARPSIEAVFEQGIGAEDWNVDGRDLRTAITRKQFARLAVETYAAVSSRLPDPPGEEPFTDTDDSFVATAYSLGIINGYGNGKFGPDDLLTREQAAVLLSNLAAVCGKPMAAADVPFTDAISPWAADGVAKCYAAGVMNGTGAAEFSPAGTYTAEQSIVTMLRILEYIGR